MTAALRGPDKTALVLLPELGQEALIKLACRRSKLSTAQKNVLATPTSRSIMGP
jgi:hypothetical protein